MEQSSVIRHAEGNVFVDAFDDDVVLSVWTTTGHARAHLTKEQARELIAALLDLVEEA
jgi:quinol monooxygenase YgiN